MAREFGGDLYDFQNMSDDEIRGIILDQLRALPNLEADDIDVDVREGAITLTGRVGTDAEVQVASALLDDVLNVESYTNDLVVDELRRGEAGSSYAMDGSSDEEIGDLSEQQTDTAEHLVENLETETYGTEDVSEAIRDASAYSPPDHPISDGYGSREEH